LTPASAARTRWASNGNRRNLRRHDLPRSTPRLFAERTFVAGRILGAFSSTVACSSADARRTYVKFYGNRDRQPRSAAPRGKSEALARVLTRRGSEERERERETERFGNRRELTLASASSGRVEILKSGTHTELTDFTCPPPPRIPRESSATRPSISCRRSSSSILDRLSRGLFFTPLSGPRLPRQPPPQTSPHNKTPCARRAGQSAFIRRAAEKRCFQLTFPTARAPIRAAHRWLRYCCRNVSFKFPACGRCERGKRIRRGTFSAGAERKQKRNRYRGR